MVIDYLLNSRCEINSGKQKKVPKLRKKKTQNKQINICPVSDANSDKENKVWSWDRSFVEGLFESK